MHGLSIYVYVYAQRLIGAAMTGAYYAVVPFIGVLLSVIIFKNALSPAFIMAVVLMALGAWLASSDEPLGQK